MTFRVPLVLSPPPQMFLEQLQSGDALTMSTGYITTNNLTINVTTTGNDATGDGSSSYPFASLARALAYLGNYTIAAGVLVIISLGPGTYTSTSTVKFDHPQGSQIAIIGNQPAATTLSAVTAFSTPSGGAATATITVASTASMVVNQYLLIPNPSGTAAQHYWNIAGCHLITAINSSTSVTVTVKTYSPNPIPANAVVTGNVFVLSTILSFTSADGISFTDSYAQNATLSMIQYVCLVTTSSRNAFVGGNVNVYRCGTYGWDFALTCSCHGSSTVNQCGFSGALNGVVASNGSYVGVFSSALNGSVNYGLVISYGSVCMANGVLCVGDLSQAAYIYGMSTLNASSCVFAESPSGGLWVTQNSVVDTSGNCTISYNTGTGILTQDLSAVYNCAACTLIGNTTAASPALAAGTAGNNGSYNFNTQ